MVVVSYNLRSSDCLSEHPVLTPLDHLEERMSDSAGSTDDFLSLVVDTELRMSGGVRRWQQRGLAWKATTESPWFCIDCSDLCRFEELPLHSKQHPSHTFGPFPHNFPTMTATSSANLCPAICPGDDTGAIYCHLCRDLVWDKRVEPLRLRLRRGALSKAGLSMPVPRGLRPH